MKHFYLSFFLLGLFIVYDMQGQYANTFYGDFAGELSESGSYNTFVGYSSGFRNSSEQNTFLGSFSGQSNTTGSRNVFSGAFSGLNNTTGEQNVFLGGSTGQENTTGSRNVFSGASSGSFNTSGADNVFLGFLSGQRNSTGNENIFIGSLAGRSNINGNANVFIGVNAGKNVTSASNKLYIQNGEENETPLIYGDFTSGSVAIGNANASGYKLYVSGDAFTTGLWVSNGMAGFAKSKVQPIENALDKINEINSAISTSTVKKADKTTTQTQYAINADDLQKVFPELVKQNNNDIAINYQGLIPVLVEAMKELKEQNKSLQQQIDALKNSESNQGSSQEVSVTSGFKLAQNIPNPFESVTTIQYYIPEGYRGASIQIFDGNGTMVKSYTSLTSGDGEITVDNIFLPAGIYHYSLIVNGKVMASKKMVIKK